jgi:hypothetical protein
MDGDVEATRTGRAVRRVWPDGLASSGHVPGAV